jgi:Mycobacterial 4 TMS phage holin, superfamily IV
MATFSRRSPLCGLCVRRRVGTKLPVGPACRVRHRIAQHLCKTTFLFVINALMFWGAAYLLDGFNVTGFTAALIGSLIYSVLSYLINTAVDSLFSKK